MSPSSGSGIGSGPPGIIVNAFTWTADGIPVGKLTRDCRRPAPVPGCQGRLRAYAGSGHLTSRQIDVLRAIADGLSARLIAGELKISENTVNAHIKAMKKLAGVTCIRPWPQHGPPEPG